MAQMLLSVQHTILRSCGLWVAFEGRIMFEFRSDKLVIEDHVCDEVDNRHMSFLITIFLFISLCTHRGIDL